MAGRGKLTFWILLISAFLVSSYDFFDSTDSAIQCYHHKKNSDRVINRYCWIMSTFTLPKYAQDDPDFQSIYPGVGETTGNEETIHHNYYQWVPMVLGFQAIFFYLPHWAWKKLEDQRLERVVKGLNQFIVNSTTRENKVEHLADFLLDRTDHMNYEHEIWARKFFACECLNLINIWAQLFLTDRFLGGLFLNYGIKVLSFPYQDPGQRYDPMALIFPRMTKCLFRKYGSSGTIQQIDVLCVLSMNIINEKIYIFLWFWFIFLATITTFWVSFRVAQRFWPKLRESILHVFFKDNATINYASKNAGFANKKDTTTWIGFLFQRKIQGPRAENWIFRVTCWSTAVVLVFCFIITSLCAFFDTTKRPIQCLHDKQIKTSPLLLNRYCWISSTFTLPQYQNGVPGLDFVQPGVGFHQDDDPRIYHAYYQWVPLFVLFQSICFLSPILLWERVDGNRFKNMISVICRKTNPEDLKEYILARSGSSLDRNFYEKELYQWTFSFVLCEVLNFVQIIGQLFLTDYFLGGEFFSYGSKVFEFSSMENQHDRVDPMSLVFPRLTKCIFHKYGGSGTIQRYDSLCVLGVNVVNEKIFIFLWFFFLLSAVLTGCNLIYRLYQMISSKFRNWLLRGKLDTAHEEARYHILESFSKWFVVYKLSQALDRDGTAVLVDAFTFAILVVFVILISSYSFIDSTGSAIQCYRDGYEYEYSSAGVRSNDKMTDVINRYCWISSTFTLPKHFDGTPGEDINYIGVGPYNAKDERIYHAYYQWVPLFLAFQAICFYFPHWLWKCLEKGDLKTLTSLHNFFRLSKAFFCLPSSFFRLSFCSISEESSVSLINSFVRLDHA
eukprot:maker-scaffold253_size237113-snap-gene-1.34 protein:Tk00291 transcript:maker-scaffold253_size237113-snap-gene-1.34-mRNA-1 annotation:"GJ15793"